MARLTDQAPAGSPVPLARELHPVHDGLPDAPALREPLVVVESVMDAGIEPGQGRFLRRLVEGAKAARLQRWLQVMVLVQRIRERRAPRTGP